MTPERTLCLTCAVLLAPVAFAAPVHAQATASALYSVSNTFIASLRGTDSVARGALVIVGPQGIRSSHGFGTTARGAPVDPERTVFRAASNSKLFAAVAALQLAEAGRWSLNEDVNRYLPARARLAARFDQPVRIRDLLTHTAGLEAKYEGAIGSVRHHPALAEYFAQWVPYRAAPPGADVSYSNTGMALVGYLVECATGTSFDQYAAERILRPLGMTHSSFQQPAPQALADEFASTPPRAARDIVFNPYPAASLVSTPADMGRFIAALLADSSPILSPGSVALMRASHWRAQPGVPAVAYGLFEGQRRGRRYLFHTGDSGDHSLVLLIPDAGVGAYLVYSGRDDQAAIRERFAAELLDAVTPADSAPRPRAPSASSSMSVASLRQFQGTYRSAAYSRTNYEKVQAMFNQVRITADGDAVLTVRPPGGAPHVRLRRTGAFTFEGDSGETAAFQLDQRGRVRGFTLTGSVWDPASWDRIGWYESGTAWLCAWVVWLVSIVARAIVAPIVRWVRRRRGHTIRKLSWWRWTGIGSWIVLAAPVVGFARAMTSFSIPAEAVTKGAHAASVAILSGSVLMVAASTTHLRHQRTAVWLAATGAAGLVLAAYWRVLPW